MTQQPVVVEACVTSVEEAVTCFDAGADRAELCTALHVGGLTPSTENVQATLSAVSDPVVVLVRPHADTFRLDPGAIGSVVERVGSLASLGVDGVVVGMLDESGRVDGAAMADVVSAADGRPVTFHRAFDEVEDPLKEIEPLIQAGVSRLLTSGGAATAWQGRHVLRKLVKATGDELTVLGGGRIRGDHVRELVEETGLREVHARAAAIPDLIAHLEDS